MIKGTTKSGFEFEISENVGDDMELVDAMADCLGTDNLKKLTGLSKVLTKLLGDNKPALYDHVRAKDGRVPTKALEAEVTEMFTAIGAAGKNS